MMYLYAIFTYSERGNFQFATLNNHMANKIKATVSWL
jgi:hypothetical protein